MLRSLPLFALICSIFVFLAPPDASAQGLPTRIGVVDFQRALLEVEDGKKAKKTLETRFEQKRQALEAKKAEIEQMKTSLEAQAVMLSADARRAKEDEYQQKVIAFQQEMMESQQEMAMMEQELTGDILTKLGDVAEQIGREQGYTLIVEAGTVVYVADGLDITAQVITRYNAKNVGATKQK